MLHIKDKRQCWIEGDLIDLIDYTIFLNKYALEKKMCMNEHEELEVRTLR